LKALMKARKLEKLYAYDIDKMQAEKFAQEFEKELEVIPIDIDSLSVALKQSRIIVTCTPSKKPFIHSEDISPGTFIAAIGADSEEKQELFSELLAVNKIVVDLVEQSAAIGELHHAIRQGLISQSCVHAELGFIIAGKKTGRESNDEIIIFDSTGTALQDVAAAAIVYEKAIATGLGRNLNFSEQHTTSDSNRLKKNETDINVLRQWFPFK
jgi:alanine dehydrogenase